MDLPEFTVIPLEYSRYVGELISILSVLIIKSLKVNISENHISEI